MKRLYILTLLSSCFFVSKGQLGTITQVSSRANPMYTIKSADLDGDGDQDLMRTVPDKNEISWFENDGNGNFSTPRIITNDSKGTKIIDAVDLNGDGLMDVIAIIGSELWNFNTMVCYENLGNGDFSTSTLVFHHVSAVYAFGDIDGDNDQDIALRNYNTGKMSVVGWLKNDGTGNFGSIDTITHINRDRGSSIALGDMDGDGHLDIVSVSSDHELVYFKNFGKGDFGDGIAKKVARTGSIEDMKVADIDGDGDLDISSYSGGNHRHNLWLENDGNGEFEWAGPKEFTSSKDEDDDQAVGLVADLDQDGDQELVAFLTDFPGSPRVAMSPCIDGSFSGFRSVTAVNKEFGKYGFRNSDVSYYHEFILADMNSDNKLDFVFTNRYELVWFENIGNLTFGPLNRIYAGTGGAYKNYAVDLDGDNDLDWVSITENSDGIAWQENLGRTNFAPLKYITYDVPDFEYDFGVTSDLQFADVNNDGKLDIIAQGGYYGYSTVNSIFWYENLGNKEFGSKTLITSFTGDQSAHSGNYWGRCSFADFDGDGDQDIVWSAYKPWNQEGVGLHWQENQLAQGFAAPVQLSKDPVKDIHTLDLDNDGNMDILTDDFAIVGSAKDVGIQWFKGNGDGTFSLTKYQNPIYKNSQYAHPVDIDSDGDLDLLHFAVNAGTEILVTRNNGSNTFGAPEKLGKLDVNGRYRERMEALATADMDGDGFEDIVWIYYDLSIKKAVWSKNDGGTGFSLPINIELDALSHINVIDLDDDADPDIMYAKNGAFWAESSFGSPYIYSGRVFYDLNENGIRESNEKGIPGFKAIVQPVSQVEYTLPEGKYAFSTHPGTHTISVNTPNELWKLTSDSSTYTRTATMSNHSFHNLDFAFHPKQIKTEIACRMSGFTSRCNTVANYWLYIANTGTSMPNGILHVQLDDSLSFVSSGIQPDSTNGQNLYWHFDELYIGEQNRFWFRVKMPAFNDTDNDLSSTFNVLELDNSGDVVYSNSDKLEQEVTCAYDPNDKQVSPKGTGPQGFISHQQELTYLIRFQNVGNDTAVNVMVRDPLDRDLDWATFKPSSSSHPYKAFIEADGDLVFKFDSIWLPDSTINEPGSHGFIEYTIRPKNDAVPLSSIDGAAKIYFDFNPPIYTNSTLNTIICYTAPKPTIEFDFPVLFAGVSGDYGYQWYRNDTLIDGATSNTYRPESNGIYTVTVTDGFTCSQVSAPYEYTNNSVVEYEGYNVSVYPNPFKHTTNVMFDPPLKEAHDLILYNIAGVEVSRISNISGKGVSIEEASIGQGLFLLYLVNPETSQRTFVKKLIAY